MKQPTNIPLIRKKPTRRQSIYKPLPNTPTFNPTPDHTNPAINRLVFQNLIKDVANSIDPTLRFQSTAIQAIHESAEAFLISYFVDIANFPIPYPTVSNDDGPSVDRVLTRFRLLRRMSGHNSNIYNGSRMLKKAVGTRNKNSGLECEIPTNTNTESVHTVDNCQI